MKQLLLFCLFGFVTNWNFSQQTDQLLTITSNERLFDGNINEKYAITLYLQYAESSGEHAGVYSLKGWYFYNNIQKKIPLVGIFDNGDITLFNFTQKEKQDSILSFTHNEMNLWSGLDFLKNMKGYNERMEFGPGTKNEWTNGAKLFKLEIFSSNPNTVLQEKTYLKTTQNTTTKFIDLNEMLPYLDQFKLEHSIHSSAQHSFLLSYDFPSNVYVQGRCGAASETGYVILNYDANFQYLSSENITIESCYDNIYATELPASTKTLKQFKKSNSDDTETLITIDMVKHVVTTKAIK